MNDEHERKHVIYREEGCKAGCNLEERATNPSPF
jgi:hypothetical protein